MSRFVIAGWLAIAGVVFAQKAASPTASALKVYTSPDAAFRFTYPGLLIHCEKRPQGAGYVWVQKECAAYFPACDETLSLELSKKKATVCLAYPRNQHTNSDTFEAATFSVAQIEEARDRSSCTLPKLDQIDRKKPGAKIGGVEFSAFETGEGGMNQGVTAEIYRTFHADKCYELTIAVVTANAGAFDPPARELTKADWDEVNHRLDQARDSFHFLK